MTRNDKPSPLALSITLGVLVVALAPGRVQAFIDMGFGWGFGGFGMRTVPSPTGFLEQHALTRAGQGMQMPKGHAPYSNSPNAYFNRVRDNGFVSHRDVSRRQGSSSQRGTNATPASAGPGESQAAVTAPALRPIQPLASFFDASQKLVWPNEAPIAGDLKEKRDLAAESSEAVLAESKVQVIVSVSSSTHARRQLIDYGLPALQQLRAQATPAIADSFHHFLLSLYDSLHQAAWAPEAGTETGPKR